MFILKINTFLLGSQTVGQFPLVVGGGTAGGLCTSEDVSCDFISGWIFVGVDRVNDCVSFFWFVKSGSKDDSTHSCLAAILLF